MTLHAASLELREANAFVASLHRHHKPVQGHRFSIGCIDDTGKLLGVLIAGRPVASSRNRQIDVLEVTRLCTDGTMNVCSFLYSTAARAAKALGYLKIQTYTLPEEGGASLKASNWKLDGVSSPSRWNTRNDQHQREKDLLGQKLRWVLVLNQRPDVRLDCNEISQQENATHLPGT